MENEYIDKLDFSIWKDFYKIIKSYKKSFIQLFFVMTFVAIGDAIFPLFSKYIIDNYIEYKTYQGIGKFIVFFILIIIFQSINVFLFIALAGKVETQMAYDIREKGFKKLQELSLSYYDNKAVGWIMARMTSDINRLSETISWSIVDFSWGVSMMIAVIFAMFYLNVKLALITMLVIPPLVVVSIYFQKRILNAQRKVRKINSQITAAYNEDISGAKTTKTLVREDLNLEEFSILTRDFKEHSIRATILSALYIPIVLVLGSIGTALALNCGGYNVVSGLMTYGTLVAFISYTMQLFEPIRQLAIIFAEVQSAQASAERVFSLLNEEPKITDINKIIEKDTWPEIKGNIEFKNVNFHYNEDEPILENFNLKVKAGETIALVGETGSGKSTIVNLLCRFYEPVSGEILIDGINYKDMPQAWLHENLGYVLQSPHLFSGTIKDNIIYGNLDASEEEVIEASKMVNAHDFIKKMEKGYNSPVGESGNLLSTGQKQLVSFARAIVRKPKLFVLDEATSSIDTETEKIIQDAITKALENRTSFVIAHRLSTIRDADRILLIDKGKILEDGNHQDLLKEKGQYYKLYTNQFIEEENKNLGF